MLLAATLLALVPQAHSAISDLLADSELGLFIHVSDDSGVTVATDDDAQSAAALALLQPQLDSLTQVFGKAARAVPLTGVIVTDHALYEKICLGIIPIHPRYKQYLEQVVSFDAFQLPDHGLLVQYFSPELEKIQGQHALLHGLVRQYLKRRFPRLPLWLYEGIACVAEFRADGDVRNPWSRTTLIHPDDVANWAGIPTFDIVLDHEFQFSSLYSYSTKPFDDALDRAAFALAYYALESAPNAFADFCNLINATPFRARVDQEFLPEASVFQDYLAKAFKPTFQEDFTLWWESHERNAQNAHAAFVASEKAADLVDLKEARAKHADAQPVFPDPLVGIRALKAKKKSPLIEYKNISESILLFSDFSDTESEKLLVALEQAQMYLQIALGPKAETKPVPVLALKNRETYHNLCEWAADLHPSYRGSLTSWKKTTGFQLYKPLFAVYFHDPQIQEEGRTINSVVHSFVHLKLYQHYGLLPAWLPEGIATATENALTGEVRGQCNLDDFIQTGTWSTWRDRPTQTVLKESPINDLFHYRPRRYYKDEMARFAFAFATWGLENELILKEESEKKRGKRKSKAELAAEDTSYAIARYCESVAHLRETAWAGIGWFEPGLDSMASLTQQAFGDDFAAQLKAWWEDAPKWTSAQKRVQKSLEAKQKEELKIKKKAERKAKRKSKS
ncbi:MAG: hypothetical protein HN405_07490 [Planctomycetes bacterium]|jgi:hypothetical protein|nr:hypothetical protein [Planctomycetota bacterium]MBT4029400.1 hypothetical protein [Planctomycetota bacterium]MBT4560773.1 hypothetical protein [Planctomycetota bacterium]MBT7012217.1 hypothetical protein [Planctomycetota bacterium]MBT7318399.1 hypothetical protein [Planctomycetota bacterium]